MRKLRIAFAFVALIGIGMAGACTSPTGVDCGGEACYDLGSGNYDLGSGN